MIDNEKIFIQIASYRDPELKPTIKDCIEKAKYPENLVFCIAWQNSVEDEWDKMDEYNGDSRFIIIDIPYNESKGACWARNQIQQKYNGEKYTLQIDSHHRFEQDWDEELIKMYNHLVNKGHEKPLITAYAPSYNPENDPESRIMVPWKMNFDRFIPEGAIFFLPSSIENFKDLTEPIPARFYSAHFAFTTGKFCLEVPHDPNYYFHGEEISIAVRAYTWGYDLFHPHKVVLWHEYTRKGRRKQWDDDSVWVQRNGQSHERNRKLFEMDGEVKDIFFGPYDFGPVRSLSDYERYSGISFKKRAIQKYTSQGKNPPNPELYGEEYESSFMSEFKHCIGIHKSLIDMNDQYLFWSVIFEDEEGNNINRKDLTKDEVSNLLKTTEDDIKIWRTFEIDRKPHKWVVWPHSETRGWINKIEGRL
jgi:hypothetical protein